MLSNNKYYKFFICEQKYKTIDIYLIFIASLVVIIEILHSNLGLNFPRRYIILVIH